MNKILVVDDQESVRNLLVAFLGRSGFKCQEASNGKEAFERMEERSFSLVISDLKMPEMDGYELLAKISTLKKPIPVIIITGTRNINKEDLDFLKSRKAFRGIIKKPFSLKDLVAKVLVCINL